VAARVERSGDSLCVALLYILTRKIFSREQLKSIVITMTSNSGTTPYSGRLTTDSVSDRESVVSAINEKNLNNYQNADSSKSRTYSATEAIIEFGRIFTLRAKSVKDFQCYFVWVLFLNLYYVFVEAVGCYTVIEAPRNAFVDAELALLLLALLFSVVDTIIVCYLFCRISKTLCVAALICMVTAAVLYLLQLVLFTAKEASRTAAFGTLFVISLVGICVQLFPLLLIYRSACTVSSYI
jgi:heme/copper-type cytochrome/quinol oxidase subunit 4